MSDAVIDQSNDTGVWTALGTLMIERGFLDVDKLDEALRVGAETGERLGEVVVRMGWASEDDLAKILADQWHLRYVERSEITFNGDALSRMSREEATRLEALPIQINEDGAIVVALAEPTDARLLALHSLLGDRIDCVVVAKTAIDAGLRSDLLQKDGSSIVFTSHTSRRTPTRMVRDGRGTALNAPVEQSTVEPDPQPLLFDSTVAARRHCDRLRRGGPDAERRPELATRIAPADRCRGGGEAGARQHRDRAAHGLSSELSDRNSQLAERQPEHHDSVDEAVAPPTRGLVRLSDPPQRLAI